MKLIHINLYSISIFLLFFMIPATSAVLRSNETDHFALMSLKAKLSYDSLQSWNQSTHYCRWTGITCGRKHMRVVEINLPSQQLSGNLSPFLGNLSFLRNLTINDNNFTGEIPPEIGRLPRLRILWLTNNSFSGKIPSNISQCLNLENIDLGGNNLVGSVPIEFQSLSKLQVLFLNNNNLTGQVLDSLSNFSALRDIYLTDNFFEGNIPHTIGRLSSLEYFEVSLNYLSGKLPTSFFNLSNLFNIDMIYNEIEGSLPSDLWFKFPKLEVLNIGGNRFTGSIPNSVSNASELSYLDISTNGFTGDIPDLNRLQRLETFCIYENLLGNGEEGDMKFISSFSNNSKLTILDLFSNNFGGTFPRSLVNLSSLTQFYVYNNPMLYGNIPDDIGLLVNLDTLVMGCNFEGGIPSSIGNLQKLAVLDLEGNNLSGDIPPSIGNLINLIILRLGNNSLEGNIPTSLGTCINLSYLNLSQNNLTGEIPPQVLSLPSLSIALDLSENRLSGSLVLEQQLSPALAQFSVADNLLSGNIPSNFGGYQSLNYLSLAGNAFEGIIPPSFSSLRGLEFLNLSQNNLSGNIPEYMETFQFLMTLSLSFNDFEGAVPVRGVFSNARNISIFGNNNLCGGVQELSLPECAIEGGATKNSRVFNLLRYIIPACIGATILLMTILAFFLYKKRHAKKVSASNVLVRDAFPQVSYRDLHRATGGFSSTNLCGSGKFSYVYKGVLDPDETHVAVKVLKLDVSGATRSFTAECEALRSMRHRNLLKIVTSCSTIDFQGNDFKALVYAFMANGSLENRLHHNSLSLTLLERLNIVIDVASALDYLHNEMGTSMVHCDIKPSNILLDSDLVAHLGDFGLLKFIREAASTANSSTSLAIKGTVGYVAPEYGMGSEISTNGDMYSFGILILEIFSGKRPTDDMFSDGLDLHNLAKMAIPDRVMNISDSPLLQNEEETSEKAKECLVSVFRVGIACSVESPTERGNISDVINELRLIMTTFLESSV